MTSTDTTPAEPLMAGIVSCRSRDTVIWPVRLLRADDTIRVSGMVPEAVIVDSQPDGDFMRTLLLDAEISGNTERVTLTVPLDTEYTLISAIRNAWPECRVCHRQCLHPYEAADCTPPTFAICVECDQRITAEVRAEMLNDAGQVAGTEKEVTADADQR